MPNWNLLKGLRWGWLWLALLWLALLWLPGLAEQLPLKLYTTADGLAHENIAKIVRDSRGFLWFCTVDGLSRFDGYRFVNYGMKDGLPHGTINDLVESRDGTYWIATAAGISRFAPARANGAPLFTNYTLAADKLHNRGETIYEDGAGNLWVGTGGGVYRARLRQTPLKFELFPLDIPGHPDQTLEINHLIGDHSGSVWVASTQGVSRILPDGRRQHFFINPRENMDWIWYLECDAQDRIWVAAYSGGVLVLKPEPAAQVKDRSGSLTPLKDLAPADNLDGDRVRLPERPGEARWYTERDGLAEASVRALYLRANGEIWLGARGGSVARFDGKRFQNFTAGLSRRVATLCEDAAGNLWVGTRSGGVIRMAAYGFLTLRKPDGLGSDDVLSIFADRTGLLTVVNNTWIINQLLPMTANQGGSGLRFQSVALNLPKAIKDSSTGNREMVQDGFGDWWISTGGGVARFSGVKTLEDLARIRPRLYTIKDGLADDNVNRVFADSRGDIWVSSYHPPVTLARWERATQTWRRFGEADGMPPNNWANRFAEDKAGNLWLGMHEGGVVRWRNGQFEYFGSDTGLPVELVQGMHVDANGRLWLGMQGRGAARCDNPNAEQPRFVSYSINDGLASNVVRSFAEDRWGRVYITHAHGVDRLELSSGKIKHFTVNDGLVSGEVMAAFTDEQGTLWFGAREGMAQFVPTEHDILPPLPPAVISGVRVGGFPLTIGELGERQVAHLEFGPNQTQLEFDFFALNFALGAPPRYQYRIEGRDRQWSAPSEERTVTTNFAPGSYRFLVRAVNAAGEVSESPAAVSFTILPPLWQRWWFLGLLALAGVGLVYLGHRYHVARVVELERVRTRIATDLHDDIGASLSRMAILSEVVKQVNGDNPQSAQMLTDIADSARGLVDSMSDIVWSIDPRRDDLQQVITRTRQFAGDVFEAQGVQWKFDVPPATEQAFAKIKLAPEQRRHLYLIFKEAINNAAKYANCRSFAIKLNVHPQYLLAEIHDDGSGFDWQPAVAAPVLRSKSRGGNGLQNMQARAAELGGELLIETAPGRGTSLRLTIPLK